VSRVSGVVISPLPPEHPIDITINNRTITHGIFGLFIMLILQKTE
jgi:hypothetical protein